MYLFLVYLAIIALFVLAVRFAINHLGARVGSQVYDLHRQTELILETRKVPEEWVRRLKERRGNSCDRTVRQEALKRMDRLLAYFRRAPVFSDDESRKQLLSQLQEIREEWLSLDSRSLLPGKDGL